MFLETVRSPGLAHLSYVIGDAGRAAVVDPRIDVDVYLELARVHDARIELVYETHRNEDVVSGARALAEATGARVLHGTALDFAYGSGAEDGSEERLGALRLRVLHTPGHTDESISIAAYDEDFGDEAFGVFTGDALFVGDVGRTDFFPDRAEEVAGLLYDGIFGKLLPLGDQALVWPAHGAGSVCGEGMASREATSLGFERRHNPRLQLTREEFVRAKTAERHVHPPYFAEMERRNLAGAERPTPPPEPRPAGPAELEARLAAGLVLVDVRSPEAYAGCSIPGSLALPLSLLSGYAGWFLPYDRPIGLVAEDRAGADEAVRQLVRMGYESIPCVLAGGMAAWATSGRAIQSIPAVSAAELAARLGRGERLTVLDVRKATEHERARLPGSHHRFLGELPSHDGLDELPRPVVTFCSSGRRALVAASLLRRAGLEEVWTCFGSMQACRAIGCGIEEGTP